MRIRMPNGSIIRAEEMEEIMWSAFAESERQGKDSFQDFKDVVLLAFPGFASDPEWLKEKWEEVLESRAIEAEINH